MNWIFEVLPAPLLHRVGWTLVHSVWQAAAAAIVLAIVLLLMRRSSASARYITACAGLFISILAPAVTFIVLSRQTPPQPAGQSVGTFTFIIPALPAPEALTPQQPISRDPSLLDWRMALPWMALAWLVGVAMLCGKHACGCIWLRKIRRSTTPLVQNDWPARLIRLKARLGIRGVHIRLVESGLVQVPSIIGWWRPIILMPVAALNELSPAYIDSILAHELAHIRRHDYFVNLIQVAIETLLFYHPGAWWISKQIRIERENCCDDLAARACGNTRTYAQALAAMEELRIASPMLAITGSTRGNLLRRIRRLLNIPPSEHRGNRMLRAWPLAGFAIVALLTCVLIPACSRTLHAGNQSAKSPIATTRPATPEKMTPTVSTPATQRSPQSSALILPENDRTRELTEAAKAYTAAQITTIEAKSRYGPQHPALLKAEQREDELQRQYESLLQEVMAQNAAEAESHRQVQSPATTQSSLKSPEDSAAIQRARELWKKAIDAEAGHDYQMALQRYREIYQLPPEAQPGALDVRTKLAAERARESAKDTAASQELLETLNKSLAQAQAQLLEAQSKFAADHPEVKNEQRYIQALQNRIEELSSATAGAAAPQVYYISGVTNAGSFSIEKGRQTLREALAQADIPAAQQQSKDLWVVLVHRQFVDGATVEKIALPQAMNQPAPLSPALHAGDVIMVTDKPPSDEQLPVPDTKFRIQGQVPRPGDYRITPGLTCLQALIMAGVNPPDVMDWYVSVMPAEHRVATSRQIEQLIWLESGQMLVKPRDVILVSKTAPRAGTAEPTTAPVPPSAD